MDPTYSLPNGWGTMPQVLNKVDLLKPIELESLVKLFATGSRADVVIPTAAKLGFGVQEVKDWASQQLQEGPSLYPKVNIQPVLLNVVWHMTVKGKVAGFSS
jgi:GTPase Era involved in 16S rRNA processing